MSEHGIPVERTSFIGRDEELAALTGAFDRGARLVTISGPPGVGKTRLARVFARRCASGGLARVRWCELSPARDGDAMLTTVASALSAPLALDAGGEGGVGRLGAVLRESGALVLALDNLEQIVGVAREAIGAWLDVAPRARFVVTSRERLGVTGEHCLDLGPLTVEQAVALFDERARAVVGTLRPEDADRESLVELVARLDRLPLAIELAAARRNVLSVRQLLVRLNERFLLLRAPGRDGERGRVTLREAIEASWSHLLPWERATLAACSLSRTAFDADLAEAIVDLSSFPDAPEIVDVLAALRDKSLLAADGEAGGGVRLRLLESVAEFAAARLDESESRDEARRRFISLWMSRGEAWAAASTGPSGVTHRERLLLEMGNLLAARDLARAVDPQAAARLALAAHPAVSVWWPTQAALDLLGAAIEDARRAGDLGVEALLLDARGDRLRQLGRCHDADLDLNAALDRARQCGAVGVEAGVLVSLARLRGNEARFPEARAASEAALECARRVGDRGREADALLCLGLVAFEQGDPDAAVDYLEDALPAARDAGDHRTEGLVHSARAVIASEGGDAALARSLQERALAMHQDVGNLLFEAIATGNLALLHHDAGELDRAEERLEQAITVQRRLGNRRSEAIARGNLACVHAERGELSRAVEELQETVATAEDLGDVRIQINHRGYLALVEAARGHLERAEVVLAEARRLLASLSSSRFAVILAATEASADLARARQAVERRDGTGRERYLQAARARLREASGPAAGIDVRIINRLVRACWRDLAPGIDAVPAEAERSPIPPRAPGDAALGVDPDGGWFETPSGRRADLRQRPVLRGLFHALLEQRFSSPGTALSVEELVRRVWPGERIQPRAAAARLYTAVSALRRLGLEGVIVRTPAGYMLHPAEPLSRVSESETSAL